MRNKGDMLIEYLEAQGKRTFTIPEATEILKAKRSNTLAILGILRRKKRIISLTQGLYALWHPSERKWGIHPLPIIDTLMKYRKSVYYVGLLSAADYYGACEQKPQVLHVIVPRQLQLRKARELSVALFVKKSFAYKGIESMKTLSGTVTISSPVLTALDIFYFESACGGFHHIREIIKNLMTLFTKEALKEEIEAYSHSSSVQKLGFVMEYYKAEDSLLSIVKKWAYKKKLAPIALTSSYPKKGHIHPLWKIVKNISLEKAL